MWALHFLDQIYLDEEYPDPVYRERREKSLIGVADCFRIQENCHCTSYGIPPEAGEPADVGLALVDDRMILTLMSERASTLPEKMGIVVSVEPESGSLERLGSLHQEVRESLQRKNVHLPGYEESGEAIRTDSDENWKKFSADCVSCGACSAICPSCSCFLLVDRPGFEKVRQLDTCQYPGFERVAGGEDSLGNLEVRFRNRYFCKYVWKPEKYSLKACTGCGRCIETCIGAIDKNKILTELANP
jgi:ferredoxin